MYAHVSAALATILERLDGTQTERFCEVVEEALALLQRPSTNDYDFEGPEFAFELFISNKLVEAFLWSKLIQKHYAYAEYERALECLFAASMRCVVADNDLYDNENPRIDDWLAWESVHQVRVQGGKVLTPGPGILAAGAGFHLVAFLVPAQEAVDAFDQLLAASPDSVNWEVVARWCLVIQAIWEEPTPNPEVRSNPGKFKGSARDFWLVARGRVLQKMSPDALASLLHKIEGSQGEVRLRTYFFGDFWDKLPQAAKDHLINADRLFYSREGTDRSIFNELRLACEAVLDDILWEPYHRWLQNRTLKDLRAVSAARDERPLGTLLGQMLQQLRPVPEFNQFVAEKYPTARQFIFKDLRQALDDLLKVRNLAEHPQRSRPQSSLPEVQNMYRKFLGIGQSGILQQLLALEQEH